ncbi:hypothetical protein [Burkholderia stagnalis]|uniref:hypothetical protein n=1 Tax=Burkholderia stagnalis TaxID=1503054 RepID=UPI000B063737|nr:hypothetical protein [Burkholderia stagnalis]
MSAIETKANEIGPPQKAPCSSHPASLSPAPRLIGLDRHQAIAPWLAYPTNHASTALRVPGSKRSEQASITMHRLRPA